MSADGVFEIVCPVQQYAWGKHGSSSKAATLAAHSNPNFKIDEATPYAELWMGAHPKGMSTIKGSGVALADWLKNNPWALGDRTTKLFGEQLPFLLKVLSVKQALSIQAHPHKALAEVLHAADPKNYPDDNHKPELCIACTEFKAMCGFRTAEDLAHQLKTVHEFRRLIGDAVASRFEGLVAAGAPASELKAALKEVFSALMLADTASVNRECENMLKRVNSTDAHHRTPLESLFLHLHADFPNDVGCFCIFILNVVDMHPGEALFLGPNEPHAYIKGDCVECMANSDNVVRAGLTPKFKDVNNLLSMLTYEAAPPNAKKFMRKQSDSCGYTHIYDCPVDDFKVSQTDIPAGKSTQLAAVDGPSVAFVLHGSADVAAKQSRFTAAAGTVFFIAAGTEVNVQASADHGSIIYRAYC